MQPYRLRPGGQQPYVCVVIHTFVAFVALQAVSVVVLPSGNLETEGSQHEYRIPGIAARARAGADVCVGDTDGSDTYVESRTKEHSEFRACC